MTHWSMFPRSMTVGERQQAAAREAAARAKAGETLSPVRLEGRTIATTFWGKSWCDNIERYRDFAYRLDRGRSYVRSGSVIHLEITRGKIAALVSGTSVYRVSIEIEPVVKQRWRTLAKACSGTIDSLLALLQGKLDTAVMTRMCDPGSGLFPTPEEIGFRCSCPDFASLCKHVAAVLYGVGARLDVSPELLFVLRHVDAAELVAGASEASAKAGRASSARALDEDDDLAALFGVELDEGPAPAVTPKAKKRAPTETAQANRKKAPAAKAKTKAPAAKAKKKAPAAKAKKKAPATKAMAKKKAPAGKR